MSSGSAHFGRDLTPAQHAAIRGQLVLIPAYVWLVAGWTIFFRQLPLGRQGADVRVFRDFVHFYVLGLIANARDAGALYDIDAQRAITSSVIPVLIDTRFPPS